jgi:hypothetical protein
LKGIEMPLQLLVFSLTILLIIMVILRFIPNRVLKPLGRIYFLHVPLLTASGLVAFCGLTWKGGTRSLLGVSSTWATAWWLSSSSRIRRS